RVHRRTQDFRDLVDGRGGRVREAHDRGSVVVYDPVENLRDEMVDLAVDDVVDSERFLHFLAVIEMPGAGPAEDDLVFPIGSLDALDELEEHRLRVRREDPAHGEGHAERTEDKRIHRGAYHALRFANAITVHEPRVDGD